MPNIELEMQVVFTPSAAADQNAMINRAQELFDEFPPGFGSERITRLQVIHGATTVLVSGSFATEDDGKAAFGALTSQATSLACLPSSMGWLKSVPIEGETETDPETLRAWPD